MAAYNVTLFGLEFTLKPVAFTIPIGSGWEIYWYGIIIALGFLSAVIYAYFNAKRFNINTEKMLDAALITTPLAILCARTYYLIFDGEKLDGIGDFFGFSDGRGFSGLAIYGGVIGAFLFGGLICRIMKINILDMFDIASLGFLIGQGIGRWGNFINQEAYGTFTGSSWWGMQSERTIMELGEGLVHPCFLYESIWCLVGVAVLHKISKNRRFSGEIILSYGAWYGFGRAIIELLRTDSLMLGSIRVSCLLSILLCITSLTLIYVIRKRIAEKSHDDEYVTVFVGEEDIEAEKTTDTENESTDNLE
ncbi:MAG: prolipoprotein diacylglyceryl transferase [Oscillospiraceae bacterium]|nr:prolipoprotein diacylglyceryl transferase [Oscillospiraceae bacterium]